MKKILILANNDIGLYKFRKELLQKLIENGNQAYISVPYGEYVKFLTEMGCEVLETNIDRRGINPIKDIKLIINYIKLFTKVSPDMVITYTIKANIYGGIISRIKKVPYAINITGLGTAFQKDGILKKIIICLYKIACKNTETVFFENNDNQKTFIFYNIVTPSKTMKVNGAGVNLEEYGFSQYPEENGELRFLFIGRVMKEKGIDEILSVAKQIRKIYTDVYFDIIGPMEDDYKDIIKKNEEEGIINYIGYKQDVKPFIRKSHCFILPSYHEGMANTLLECGAMGRPLITSDIAGCKEAVVEKVSGYLVKVRESSDLFEKVIKFIETSYTEKINMGLYSRKHIEKEFDRKNIVISTIERLKL